MQVVRGECRLVFSSIKDSRKNIKFCSNNCNHYTEVDLQNNCMCCGESIIRISKLSSEIKKFKHVIQVLGENVEMWKDVTDPTCNPTIPMKLGTFYYQVDIKYLKEFKDLKENQYTLFLARVKKNCPKIGSLHFI